MFFKIVRHDDSGIFDIVRADSREQAYLQAISDYPNLVCWVEETTRAEWHRWRTTDWSQIDRFEADMVAADRF